MKNKTRNLLLAAVLLLLLALLCACGGESAAPAMPEETPEPTPEPTPPPTEYTVTTESPEEILALAEIPSLLRIDATASTQYPALLALYEARPDCEVLWNYEFDGTLYPNTVDTLKVTNLEGLEDALRYLPALSYVDVIDTEATVEDLDRYDAIRPDIFYYWAFDFDGFHIRTDIQVYSSLRDAIIHRFTSEELYPLLKYCKHLKALDLGHNAITDISLIGDLQELEVLILADNPIEDASPIGKLHNLTYLELFMCHNIEDFSFLNELTNLREINLCYDEGVTNLDFLAYMPDYTFGMFKFTNVTQEDFAYWKAQYPEAISVLWGDQESVHDGWRETMRNYQIRYAFTNWRHVTNYNSFDDVSFDFSGYNY